MLEKDRKEMRSYRIDHGQKVKQNTVRNTSTKDKAGTLTLNWYIHYEQQTANRISIEYDVSDSEKEVIDSGDCDMFDDTDTDVSDSDCEPNSTTASTSQVSRSGRRIRANVQYLDFI